MITHELQQGSPEWNALRAKHFTASEAPAMLGLSKYKSRAELLREKATGINREIDAATQRRFDDGHAAEAATRSWAEAHIGEELYPVTASLEVEGLPLLASFDGINMMETVCWEQKLWNEEFAQQVMSGIVPDTHWPQLEQQLLVSGADYVLFTVSDGNGKVVHTRYKSQPERRAHLIAGWKQFSADLAAYQHVEAAQEFIGKAPDQLPALRIEVSGMVTASNLAEFKAQALAVIGSVNTDLQTDQDFADADKTTKWCKDVEDRLEAAKNHALSQTASIDELFRTIDAIKEEARQKRLALEKLVKSRKDSIRIEKVQAANAKFAEHLAALQSEIAGVRLNLLVKAPDFAGAIKGLKTIDSLNAKIDASLANGKIESERIATEVRAKLAWFEENAKPFAILFDLQSIIGMERTAFEAVVKNRIAEQQTYEAKRMEAERERIRQEEEAKARAKVEAETKSDMSKNQQKINTSSERVENPAEIKHVTRPSDGEVIAALQVAFGISHGDACDLIIEVAESLKVTHEPA